MAINYLIHFLSAILFLFLLKKVFKNLFKSKVEILKDKLYQYNNYLRQSLTFKQNFNAFEYIVDMGKQGINPDIHTFNILIHNSIEQGNFTQATEILEAMQNKYQIAPDHKALLAFFKGIQAFQQTQNQLQKRDIKKIIKRIYRIVKHNYLQVNILVGWMVKFNFIELALHYYERHKEKNNQQIALTIIKALKNPTTESIEKYYDRILEIYYFLTAEDKDFKPDEPTLNHMIELCLNAGDSKKAQEIYEQFKKFDIQPTGITFGILMKGFGNIQDFNQTIYFYDQVKKNGIPLNEITIGCLIDSCIKCNKLDKAEQIVNSETELQMNTIIYTTIIKGYTKKRNLQKALQLFEKMKLNEYSQPNTITYNSLLECCIQCQNYNQLKLIFEECVKNKNLMQEADLITYSTYIKGLCRFRSINEALKVFNELRDLKVYKIDEIMYNSILDGLCKAQEHKLALEIYEKMVEDKVEPSNVTYSILIKLYTNMGNFDKALSILDDMKKADVIPGLIVYTCLIQTYVKTKQIKKVIDLYYEIKESDVLMDKVFYNTVISGLIFNNYIGNALQISNEAFRAKIVLNQEVYHNIFTNLARFQKSQILENEDTIIQFYRYLNKNKCEIDLRIYNQVVKHMISV